MAYPATVDTLPVNHADGVAEVIAAEHVNALARSSNAIQTELGVAPRGAYANVVSRLDRDKTVRKTADQAFTAVTAVAVTDLAFPVVAGVDYTFEFFVAYLSASAVTTGVSFGVTAPAVTGFLNYNVDIGGLAATGSAANTRGNAAASGTLITSTAALAASTIYMAHIFGILSNPSASGTLQLVAATEVASSQVSLKKGSSGRLTTN